MVTKLSILLIKTTPSPQCHIILFHTILVNSHGCLKILFAIFTNNVWLDLLYSVSDTKTYPLCSMGLTPECTYIVHVTPENYVLFSNDTGILGKRNSECSEQESNLRPSDY